jgi:hypothetical protein
MTIGAAPQLSSPGLTGRSSTPRRLDSSIAASGILDHPLEPVIGLAEGETRWRVMTAGGVAVIAHTPSRSRGACARVLLRTFRRLKTEGAGNAGRQMRPQPRVQNKKAHERSHHGHTGFTRHSLRNGFNGFLRALPGDRACLPPSLREMYFAKLDASVGASGPHDFAVRKTSTFVFRAACVHRIPFPTSVTIASRPSSGTGCPTQATDLHPT